MTWKRYREGKTALAKAGPVPTESNSFTSNDLLIFSCHGAIKHHPIAVSALLELGIQPAMIWMQGNKRFTFSLAVKYKIRFFFYYKVARF